MMKNSIRKLSALMAIIMVLSLLAALPAISVSADAEAVTVTSVTLDTANTTSSERDGSAAIESLIDGNKGNGAAWNGSAFCRTGTGATTSVILALAEATTVSSVVVYGVADNAGSAQGVSSISVDLSSDGTTWAAAEVTLSGSAAATDAACYAGDVTATLATATEASYVRVTLAQFKYLGGFEEIEVMAEAAPVPGSAEAPLDAGLSNIPGSITTETLPAGGELYYTFFRIGGSIITINDADATLTNGSEVVTAVDGVLTYNVPAMNPMMPAILVFGNAGSEDKAFTVEFAYPVGSMSNPEALEELGAIDATVAAGNTEGYYYTWTAPEAGTVTATISSSTEGAIVDLAITNQSSSAMRNISADGVENEFGEVEIVIEVSAGDVLSIQAAVLPDDSWNYPTTDTDISFYASFAAVPGTENNPIVPDFFDIPGSFDTVEIGAGETVYYQLYNASGTILSIEANVTVTVDGTKFEAVDGVVEFVVPASLMPRAPITLAITNNGEEAASYTVNFALPVGAMGNPEIIEDYNDIEASLDEGDYDGYFYQWTADEDGVFSVKVIETTEGTEADIVLSNANSFVVKNASDADENGVISIEVSAGDVITVQVVAIADESTNYMVPASDITFSVDFAGESVESGDESTESTESTESVESTESTESIESTESVESTESSETEDETPDTGDTGMAVFALLAVISLAGVVVAKKVK